MFSSALGVWFLSLLLLVIHGTSTAPTFAPSMIPSVVPTSTRSAQNNVYLYAGTGVAGATSTGGQATSVTMYTPRSVWQDAAGITYFSQQLGHCVCKIGTSGIVNAFAGVCTTSAGSYGGDNAPASSAGVNGPIGLFVSTVGVAYIAEFYNHRVRSVSTAGIITTYAGSGSSTNSGNGGAATSGGIYQCHGLWLNSVGVLYVTSLNSHQVRSVSAAGILSLFVGTGVNGYSGEGGQATSAQVYGPEKLIGDSTGLVYLSDSYNHRVRTVSTAGIINVFMGSGSQAWGSENVAATSANINFPDGLCKDITNGDFYVSARSGDRVVVYTASSGLVSTFAGTGASTSTGDGGAATSASFIDPDGLFLTSGNILLVVEISSNKIRQVYSVAPTALPSVVPTFGPTVFPTVAPSTLPSVQPSVSPSFVPTVRPTVNPSIQPTVNPSEGPTLLPTVSPTMTPTVLPSVLPSILPSQPPTVKPSEVPTLRPSLSPTVKPTFTELPIQSSPSFMVINALAFAGITSTGGVMSWGAACCGGDSSSVGGLLGSLVKQVIQSKNAFAALKSDGSVVAWGFRDDIAGSTPYRSYATIVSLVATERAFAGVTVEGGVIAFGAGCCGGNVDQYGWAQYLNSDVSSVRASAGAFCALKTDGTVYCWGSKFSGGGESSLSRSDLSDIVFLSSTRSAFAGMTSGGSVVVWGNKYFGGALSSDMLSRLNDNTLHVVSNTISFAAYTRDETLEVWGGYEGSSVGGFKFVASTATAFAALRFNGTVSVKGDTLSIADASAADLTSVSVVVGNTGAFAAITPGGEVVAWGDSESGGRLFNNMSSAIGSGVTTIHHTARAFAVVNSAGAVTAWGNGARGGSISVSIANEISSNVRLLCASDNAFTGVKNDGTAYLWSSAGDSREGLISGDYSLLISC